MSETRTLCPRCNHPLKITPLVQIPESFEFALGVICEKCKRRARATCGAECHKPGEAAAELLVLAREKLAHADDCPLGPLVISSTADFCICGRGEYPDPLKARKGGDSHAQHFTEIDKLWAGALLDTADHQVLSVEQRTITALLKFAGELAKQSNVPAKSYKELCKATKVWAAHLDMIKAWYEGDPRSAPPRGMTKEELEKKGMKVKPC